MYLQLISVVVVIRLADVRMYVRAMVRIWGLSLHVCRCRKDPSIANATRSSVVVHLSSCIPHFAHLFFSLHDACYFHLYFSGRGHFCL